MSLNRDQSEFVGKTAVVTGAASGIGLATAKKFAAARTHVYALDIQHEMTECISDELSDFITFIRMDLNDAEGIAATFERIGNETDTLHFLVNNAGIADVAFIESVSLEEWRQVINVNLMAPFLCVQAAIPMLRRAGNSSVINIASIAGKRMSYLGGAAYTSAKSGLLGFTRHAAYELAHDGIRVNAVCPGPTLTPMVVSSASQEEIDKAAATLPLGDWASPDDIANAVIFLASDASRMCTGGTIDVDAGFYVSNGTPYSEYRKRRSADSD